MKKLKILISAGPTRENIDPVRFLSNRSSGKMGYSLAIAARDRGAQVTLVSGPVVLERPENIDFFSVESAAEMADAIIPRAEKYDMIIMAAAVADFRPARKSSHKIKKTSSRFILNLKRTRDILLELGKAKKPQQVLVGFAAESENMEKNAMLKLKKKNLDWIIANDISSLDSGFAVNYNSVTLFNRSGESFAIPRADKRIIAEKILENICGLKNI